MREQQILRTPPHLGGHQNMSWIDEPVLDYLIERYQITSMLDVGCGLGAMIDLAQRKGLDAAGIDGDPQIDHADVTLHDYTRGPLFIGHRVSIDLIWCVEFVEHVEERFIPHFLATFNAGRVLFLTAAYPGQGGHHHVNEQPDRYWIALLGQHGWIEDLEATLWVREHGATPFSRLTGMVFTQTARSS